jgi:membrane dipeptidase
MEGGHALEDSLGALRAYYDLGVRYMTLTHNVSLAWADAAAGVPRNGGLSDFGREVVREMNRLGMMVDLSHTSPKVMADAMDVSEAPVIFSHSCARALADQARNVPDDILKRLPDQGGVVMVTFVPLFVSGEVAAWWAPVWPQVLADPTQSNLERVKAQHIKDAGPEPKATLAQVADQIDYVRKVAGVDHVGIGGDFPATAGAPVGLEDVSKYPDLFAELIRRGWTDADLEKLAGGNVLRVMRRAEEVAVRAATSRRPSLARMTAAGASAPPSILGVWRGQSTCIKDGVHPACKDETVIYTFRPVAGREDAVVLDAEKLVDGVPSLMGALDLAYDRERAEWAVELETPNMHARWAFVVHGDEILGTLTDLPSGHLTRHAFARKSP